MACKTPRRMINNDHDTSSPHDSKFFQIMIPKTLQALLYNLYNKLIWLLAKSPPIFRMSVIYIHYFLYIIVGETSMVTIH